MVTEPYITTIWCDDIRMELGGKQSFMGVYADVIFVPKFPITLPKLCVFLKIVFPKESSAGGVSVKITNKETVLIDVEMNNLPRIEEQESEMVVGSSITLNNVEFTEKTELQVILTSADKQILSQPFQVLEPEPSEQQSPKP